MNSPSPTTTGYDDPEIIKCPTCHGSDIKARSSWAGIYSRITRLRCRQCGRDWKIRGRTDRILVSRVDRPHVSPDTPTGDAARRPA